MALDASAPETFRTGFDRLHQIVAAEVGFDDFGDDGYREGLQVLLASMDYDPHFSDYGRQAAWRQLVDALSSRVIGVRSMAQNPGFDARPIEAPVVITGVPRTGTTALHKLMAVDPQFQGLEKWLLGAPMPRPPKATWRDNPHFHAEVTRMMNFYGAAPETRVAHNMVAEEVDECVWVERSTFVSHYWPCAWSAANYDAWWQAQDTAPTYRTLARTLQLVGLNDPERRWLLKNPAHILSLDQLFATFPDARVIQTHRDPAFALPSLCSMLMPLHDAYEVGRRDQRAHNMCVREIAKYAKGLRNAEPVRAAHASQVMDVRHRDFHADPLGVVRRIYGFLDLEMSPDVEAAMQARIAEAPELAFGVHNYHVSDFGLTEDEIRRRFGDYVDRFDLRPA